MHQLRVGIFWSTILLLLKISFSSAYAESKPDFKKYAAGPERKKVFINYVRPLIDKANASIKEDRKFILNLHNSTKKSKKVSDSEKKKLSKLFDYYRIIENFNKNNINLTKIESRPTKTNTWEYNFYVDFEGHQNKSEVLEMLNKIKEETLFIKILGSYPSAKLS